MDNNDLTIVISYAGVYDVILKHNLDILKELGFTNIRIDCFRKVCDIKDYKVTVHCDPHGSRCFYNLAQIETKYVVILDSDFLCLDKNFWEDSLDKLKNYAIVSIDRPWVLSLNMLTTPFVAYRRKDVLEMLPESSLWNHFSYNYPKLKQDIFDNLQYLFFLAMSLNKSVAVDTWALENRKYKFCHLWDSRHTYEDNILEYNTNKDKNIKEENLAFGLNKFIYLYTSGVFSRIPENLWQYMKEIKSTDLWQRYTQDTLKNMPYCISFKPDWVKRFNIFCEQLERNII